MLPDDFAIEFHDQTPSSRLALELERDVSMWAALDSVRAYSYALLAD
jgi:hypothetical protein